MNSWLCLWFESPLQSWGASSKFDRRETMPFPTKSGVYGLILSAMGKSGEQKELLEKLSKMNMEVFSYSNRDNNVMLEDYHLVGGGYDESDEWEVLHIPKKADGKKPVGTGNKITYRYYLQNAKFGVLLEIPDEIKNDIEKYLKNPVYQIYLGRKNCVPTELVFQGIYDTKDKAFSRLKQIADSKKIVEKFRVVEGKSDGDESFYINDVPIQFGSIKKYKERLITIIKTDSENGK